MVHASSARWRWVRIVSSDWLPNKHPGYAHTYWYVLWLWQYNNTGKVNLRSFFLCYIMIDGLGRIIKGCRYGVSKPRSLGQMQKKDISLMLQNVQATDACFPLWGCVLKRNLIFWVYSIPASKLALTWYQANPCRSVLSINFFYHSLFTRLLFFLWQPVIIILNKTRQDQSEGRES